MPQIEVSLPDQADNEIDRLVEQGEFINRDQAFEELLSLGVSAYDTSEETSTSEVDETMFTNVVDDQQDPAMQQDQGDDDYQF